MIRYRLPESFLSLTFYSPKIIAKSDPISKFPSSFDVLPESRSIQNEWGGVCARAASYETRVWVCPFEWGCRQCGRSLQERKKESHRTFVRSFGCWCVWEREREREREIRMGEPEVEVEEGVRCANKKGRCLSLSLSLTLKGGINNSSRSSITGDDETQPSKPKYGGQGM